jgi:Tfp pilus assembly protein PilF
MNSIRKIMTVGVTSILVITYSYIGASTTGSIEGIILDSVTNEALKDVKVTLVSTRTETLSFKLKTDGKGQFYKSGIIPGMYNLTLEKEGYIPQGGSIRVQLNTTSRLEFKLEPFENPGSTMGPIGTNAAASGLALISVGKYEEAIIKFTEVIGQAPLNPIPYFYRGLSNERSEKYEEALEDYRKATELKSDFILPYKRAGIIWAKQGNFEKAIEFYKKSLNSGDQDSVTQYNYGACLINLGKKEEARSTFETLIDQDPDYSDAYYQLGIIYLSAGEIERAIELLETFIAKDPENNKTPQTREILKTLKEKHSATD